MDSNNDEYNVEEYLPPDIGTILIDNREKFLLTGTTLLFGEGNDIDYVVKTSQIKDLTGINITKKMYDFASIKFKEYNFIIVYDDSFSDWELATKTANTSVKILPQFKNGLKRKRIE